VNDDQAAAVAFFRNPLSVSSLPVDGFRPALSQCQLPHAPPVNVVYIVSQYVCPGTPCSSFSTDQRQSCANVAVLLLVGVPAKEVVTS
jgi:hypothetical protein